MRWPSANQATSSTRGVRRETEKPTPDRPNSGADPVDYVSQADIFNQGAADYAT